MALVLVVDGKDVNADQFCHNSHFAVKNSLSKTADQVNPSASACLDFDMYPVSEQFGQRMRKAKKLHIHFLHSFVSKLLSNLL